MAPIQFSHKVERIKMAVQKGFKFYSYIDTFPHLNEFLAISEK